MMSTPFPEFSKFATKWSPFYGKRYHWYAMWQTCYMSALALWNPDSATDAALEEANRLYNSLPNHDRDDAMVMQYLIPGWVYDHKKPCLVR